MNDKIRVFRRYLMSTFVWPGRLMPSLFEAPRSWFAGDVGVGMLRVYVERMQRITRVNMGLNYSQMMRLQQAAMPRKTA